MIGNLVLASLITMANGLTPIKKELNRSISINEYQTYEVISNNEYITQPYPNFIINQNEQSLDSGCRNIIKKETCRIENIVFNKTTYKNWGFYGYQPPQEQHRHPAPIGYTLTQYAINITEVTIPNGYTMTSNEIRNYVTNKFNAIAGQYIADADQPGQLNFNIRFNITTLDLSSYMNLYQMPTLEDYNNLRSQITANNIYNSETNGGSPYTKEYGEDLNVESSWFNVTTDLITAKKFYIVYTNAMVFIPTNDNGYEIAWGDYIEPMSYIGYEYTFNMTVPDTYINYDVIDLPGMMFTILGMPFSFISTAFNLTLFPNTPYSVDIGNMILGLLTLLIIFFIIKVVIKASK